MDKKTAGEILNNFYECRTKGDYLCAAPTCMGCEKFNSEAERNEALLMAADVLKDSTINWISSAISAIRDGTDFLISSKGNIVVYQKNGIIHIDMKA